MKNANLNPPENIDPRPERVKIFETWVNLCGCFGLFVAFLRLVEFHGKRRKKRRKKGEISVKTWVTSEPLGCFGLFIAFLRLV
jgi:hypothetical protein